MSVFYWNFQLWKDFLLMNTKDRSKNSIDMCHQCWCLTSRCIIWIKSLNSWWTCYNGRKSHEFIKLMKYFVHVNNSPSANVEVLPGEIMWILLFSFFLCFNRSLCVALYAAWYSACLAFLCASISASFAFNAASVVSPVDLLFVLASASFAFNAFNVVRPVLKGGGERVVRNICIKIYIDNFILPLGNLKEVSWILSILMWNYFLWQWNIEFILLWMTLVVMNLLGTLIDKNSFQTDYCKDFTAKKSSNWQKLIPNWQIPFFCLTDENLSSF